MLFASEIIPGLVVVLDQTMLPGPTDSPFTGAPARGAQFFLCVWTTRTRSGWVPCFDTLSDGREEVPAEARSGPDAWVACPCFIDTRFVFNLRNDIAVRAAHRDHSHPGLRNRISPYLF
jgi:hypothetical protein